MTHVNYTHYSKTLIRILTSNFFIPSPKIRTKILMSPKIGQDQNPDVKFFFAKKKP
jgi:hypothetical protein